MADPLSNAPTEAGAPGAPGRTASALQPGMVLGDTYEITRIIGQGGMGAVWEAKHLRLSGKRVVVKVLLHGGAEAVVLARFRREAEIGSRLGHPNIVQVLDFNTLPDGSPYIVLELLNGETLASRLRRGRLSLDQVRSVVTQVGSALSAAHREGIVHRDLKPDNIFMCPTDLGGEMRDVVKILDFGISKMRDARTVLTQDSALIGTPQYMAPEQATGANDEIDARTDVFALGAITFEMMAGRPPFWGDSLASVVHAVVYAPSPPLLQHAPDAPPGVAAAVARALEKSRDARFPDVSSFVRAVTGAGTTPPASEMGYAPTVAAVATPMPGGRPPAAPIGGGTMVLDDGSGGGGGGPGGAGAPSKRITAPERPQSAIPTDQLARPRPFPAGKLLAGLAVVGAAVAVAVFYPRQPPVPPQLPDKPVTVHPVVLAEETPPKAGPPAAAAAPPPPPAAAVPAAAAPPAEPAAPSAPIATAEPEPREPARPAGMSKHGKGAGAKGGASRGANGSPVISDDKDKAGGALSPAAAADLDQAEAALAAGKAADALRLAQHSLYAQKSSRAYAVMARARCAQGDLGNAKAAFAHVAGGEKAAVLRACKQLGIELR